MTKKTNLQKNYSTNKTDYQLILPLDVEYLIPPDDSVRLVNKVVDKMNLTSLYQTYNRIDKYQIKRMLKIIIYANMNNVYSSREIEKLCKRDINFLYLLEQKKAPDHSTIARFQNEHFSKCCEELLSEQVEFLKDNNEISCENIFIDGTKIEAVSNKYTFVWKRAVTKNLSKTLDKANNLIQESKLKYAIEFEYVGSPRLRVLKKYRKQLYIIKKQNKITFVHGIGKRKTDIQRDIEDIEFYIAKIKEYVKKIHICGTRNSYSKTDTDATFMRMKEDAMMNGQLKPAYNIQHGVDSEYITWLTVSERPTDTQTLIPFLESMKDTLSFKYKNIVADAGYESEENYVYLEKNNQVSYIKPSNYEISKKRAFRKDISRVENMEYDANTDSYTCKNNKKLELKYHTTDKTASGYERKTSVYSCNDCSNCEMKEKCIKNRQSKLDLEKRNKNLYVSKTFQRCRKENLERITCEKGCLLRMNRSIQVEGSFGVIKQDMGFKRFLCKGKNKVKAECFLLAIAFNINKLHNKTQSNRTQSHLFKLKTA